MENPILYVFAGGNGAGKSTFSADLTPADTVIINPDLIAQQAGNSYIANERIGQLKADAIAKRKSILIETNFLFEDEIDSFLEFKNAGFAIHLFYFVLSSLKESELRVHARRSKGGHFVDDYTRELNFTVGLANAIHNAIHFDEVRLIANSIYMQQELLHTTGQSVIYENTNTQAWTLPLVQQFKTALLA